MTNSTTPAPTLPECNIIGSHWATGVQVALIAVAATLLIISWRVLEGYRIRLRGIGWYFPFYREIATVPRPWRIWFRDNTKQALSSGAAHFIGSWASITLHSLIPSVSECDFYLIVFLFDTIEGAVLTIILHRLSARLFCTWTATADLSTPMIGEYGGDANGRGANNLLWAKQCLHWLVCGIAARFITFGTMRAMVTSLGQAAFFMGKPMENDPNAHLIVVVVVVPLVLDYTQFAVQNVFLRGRRKPAHGHDSSTGLGEPLVEVLDKSNSGNI